MSSSFSSDFLPEDNFNNFSLAGLHYRPVKYSYLYELFNINYHIKCEEIIIEDLPIINRGHQYDNVYHFDYKEPDTERVYYFTCRRLSPTFMFQFLNKYIYGIEFTKFENQEAFSVEHQDILRDRLIKDLTCYLEQNQFPTQNEILGLKFIEEYQNYTAISNIITAQLSGPSNENENLEKETSRKCVWHEEPVKLLLSFLIKHKKEVNQLAAKRGRGGNIKTKLWDDAVAMLSENGYHGRYTSKQCSIKWKNIKKDYKDNNNQSQYKSEVEEILNGNETISAPGSFMMMT
ncbi:hypothetical protein RclHR1_05690007 [Rhizophagus clarus]|uniref:Myb/SANT-like DNA-binding domain-containing protein n=1 Tax=Rhizophagus clarus TaxID=94130 RepID=A0A2Z6SGH0_9GLOM|nr:hypothetical protein RclHR1_05690007 [Rhizophagus clarus]GES73820.1 hypothetical protein GLOIN_2v1772781 [Rhizophagus clarus]